MALADIEIVQFAVGATTAHNKFSFIKNNVFIADLACLSVTVVKVGGLSLRVTVYSKIAEIVVRVTEIDILKDSCPPVRKKRVIIVGNSGPDKAAVIIGALGIKAKCKIKPLLLAAKVKIFDYEETVGIAGVCINMIKGELVDSKCFKLSREIGVFEVKAVFKI